MTTTTTPTAASGVLLCRALRGKPPSTRARLAADLVRGKVTLVNLTPSQAARLCTVNVGNVSVALGNRGKRGPRDRTIDKVVRRYGADALMRGLDRATSPQRIAAE